MAKAKQVLKGKIIKKDWFPIKASQAFESTFLGESYVTSPDMLVGRHLTVNLANLTGDIRQQGISIKFMITSVDDGAGVAEVVGYEASSSQLRRLVRRGVDRIDDAIECIAAGGQRIAVKPFAVTKTATGKQKMRIVRAILRKAIAEEAAKHSFDDLIKLVISNQLQLTLKNAAKKVYPLKSLEIRKLEIVSGQKPEQKPEAGQAEAKEEAKEPESKEAGKEAEAVSEPKEAKEKHKPAKQRKKAEETAEETAGEVAQVQQEAPAESE